MDPKSIAEALPDIDEAAKLYFLYCKQNSDLKYAEFSKRMVPSKEKMIGVRMPLIRLVANPIKKQDPKIIKAFINELWGSKLYEDRLLAAILATFLDDWNYLVKIAKTADSWPLTDELCCHALGPVLVAAPKTVYPKYLAQLKKWARSKNKWLRRMAAVSLIQWMKCGRPKREPLEVLDMLMLDDEHSIKKATDWMLREWAKKENKPAFDYMMKWAKKGNKHTRSVLMAASWKLTPAKKKTLRAALK